MGLLGKGAFIDAFDGAELEVKIIELDERLLFIKNVVDVGFDFKLTDVVDGGGASRHHWKCTSD